MPTRIQQHGLRAETWEVVFDLEARRLRLKKFRQQPPQAGDVPLAVAQFVDQAVLGFLLRSVKRFVEGTVGRLHPQLAVENDERLAKGCDDVVGIGKGLLQLPFSVKVLHVHKNRLVDGAVVSGPW